MTGSECSARYFALRPASATGDTLFATPARPLQPPPESRIEDDAALPEDDDPWLDDEESEDEGLSPPKRPFWNR